MRHRNHSRGGHLDAVAPPTSSDAVDDFRRTVEQFIKLSEDGWGTGDRPPSHASHSRLTKLIDTLPEPTVRKLVTLTYFGQGEGVGGNSLAGLHKSFARTFPSVEENREKLRERAAVLHNYLRDGLDRARDLHLDIEQGF